MLFRETTGLAGASRPALRHRWVIILEIPLLVGLAVAILELHDGAVVTDGAWIGFQAAPAGLVDNPVGATGDVPDPPLTQ